MIRITLEKLIPAYLLTLLSLIVLEILGSTVFPLLGLAKYRLPFNVIVILYISFRLSTPYTAILIFGIQYFHSFFSIEGWGMGTFIGVILSMSIMYMRELVQFTSKISTAIISFVFQLVWFLILVLLMYFKTGHWEYLHLRIWVFAVESVIISFLAPILFLLFDKIWSDKGSVIVEEGR